MNDEKTIPIIALEPVPGSAVVPTQESEDAFSPQAKPMQALWGFGKKKEVDSGRLREGLEKIQGELGEIFASLRKQPADTGFALSEVSVALSVSGEGSIGVATAGVEASITLTFSRGE
jgi:hypothetical protein